MSPQRRLNHCERSFQIRRKFAGSLILIEREGSARRQAREAESEKEIEMILFAWQPAAFYRPMPGETGLPSQIRAARR
jgi:hypothetical protein